jgi:hypothetical protein
MTTKQTITKVQDSIDFLCERLKETEDKPRQIAIVEMIEILRGRLEMLTMIDVEYLVKKAQSGNERAERTLIQRYGKVITFDLIKEST